MRLIGRRRGNAKANAGTDQVVFGISLPSDTIINRIRGDVTVVANASITVDQSAWAGMEGYLLPILDIDAAEAHGSIWDRLVPKDVVATTLDLDTSAVDATPFFEPGRVDWTAVFDIGLRPEKLYGQYKLLTVHNAAFSFKDSETPFEMRYVPSTTFRVRINRRLRVRQPSVMLFAVSSPNTTETTTTEETALEEDEWGRVKYFGEVLNQAMLHTLGVVEAGAETPYEEASALIRDHLEPPMYEDNAGRFVGMNFECFADALIDHSVPGYLGKGTVSTTR